MKILSRIGMICLTHIVQIITSYKKMTIKTKPIMSMRILEHQENFSLTMMMRIKREIKFKINHRMPIIALISLFNYQLTGFSKINTLLKNQFTHRITPKLVLIEKREE